MTLRPLRATLALALSVPAPAAAQAVLLRLTPPQGQVSAYAFQMTMTMNMAGMGEMDIQTAMRMTQTVTAVDGDIYTMRMVIDSMAMSGGPGMPPEAANELQGITMTVRMDSRGRQVAVDLPDQLPAPMPGLNGSSLPQGFAQVFLPEEPVTPGTEWTDDEPVTLEEEGAGFRVDKHLTYRFEGVERVAGARHARIAIAGTMHMTWQAGAAQSMTSTGDVRGTVVLDLDRGRFVSYGMEMDMLMEMPGMQAPTGMHMTMTGALVPEH